jgi:dUTP pyrophosphatase
LKIQIIKKTYLGFEPTLPFYASSGAAGMDVSAYLSEAIEISPAGLSLIPTGISIALPKGYECQVRSRSGLAAKNGVFCLNSPGTIDSDYRGEIKVILANFGKNSFTIKNGDRIAQLVIAKYEKIDWELRDSLPETERAEGGFGSTG